MPDEIHTINTASPCTDSPYTDVPRAAAELNVLRALCSVRATPEQRSAILRALGPYSFAEPEHQLVWEAVRALPHAPAISASVLAVRLNNLGFPDLDLEKYFANPSFDIEDVLRQARRLTSDGHPSD